MEQIELEKLKISNCVVCNKPKKWKLSKGMDNLICEYCTLFLSEHPRAKGETIDEWKQRMSKDGFLAKV